jgi:hypothetical protein
LEYKSGVSDHTDGFFRQVKLAEMEVRLELLKVAEQMVIYVLWMEGTIFTFCGQTQYTAKTFSDTISVKQ